MSKLKEVYATYSLDVPTLTQLESNKDIDVIFDRQKYRGQFIKSILNNRINFIPINNENGRFHSKFKICSNQLWIRTANLALEESKKSINFEIGPINLPEKFNPTESNLLVFQDGNFFELKNELPFKTLLRWITDNKIKKCKMTICSPIFVSTDVLSNLIRNIEEVQLYIFSSKIFSFNNQDNKNNFIDKVSKKNQGVFTPAGEFDLHGKLVYVECENINWLYVGSSNFTKKGFVKGNVETGIIYESTKKSVDEFQKNINRVRCFLSGNWQKESLFSSKFSNVIDDIDEEEVITALDVFGDYENYQLIQEAQNAVEITFSNEVGTFNVSIKKKYLRKYYFKIKSEENIEKLKNKKNILWYQGIGIELYRIRGDEIVSTFPVIPPGTSFIDDAIDVDDFLTIYKNFGNVGQGLDQNNNDKRETSRLIKTRVAIPWKSISDKKFKYTPNRMIFLKNSLQRLIGKENKSGTDIERILKIFNIIHILESNNET